MSTSSTQVVLGAKGSIAQGVLKELLRRQLPIRAVSRSIPPSEQYETQQADLLDLEQTKQAVAGAEIVYLCVGLPYRTEVWNTQWEIIMEHTIEACAEAGAKLVFLDNIYLYGPAPLQAPITEDHPQHPPSVKGAARKRTVELFMQAIQTGKIEGLIGRAPDIYGPGAINSTLYNSFLERMLQGKAPQFLGDPNQPHNFAHVDDLGRALVWLAIDEGAYGQAWHLPTGPVTTVQALADQMNQILGTNYKVQAMSGPMVTILSWFIPIVKEVKEMLYQFRHPYEFDWTAFQQRYPDFSVTTYADGLREMVDSFRG